MVESLDTRFRGNDAEKVRGSRHLQMRCMLRLSVLFAGLFVMSGILLFGGSAHEEKPGASPTQSTAKPKAKKVYTNEDLNGLKDTTRVNQQPRNHKRSAEGRKTAALESRAIATRQAMTVSIGKRRSDH